jgi:predicted ATPase
MRPPASMTGRTWSNADVERSGVERPRRRHRRRYERLYRHVSEKRGASWAELEEQAERQRIGLAPRPLKNPRVTGRELDAFWEATRGASRRSRAFIEFVRPHLEELLALRVRRCSLSSLRHSGMVK